MPIQGHKVEFEEAILFKQNFLIFQASQIDAGETVVNTTGTVSACAALTLQRGGQAQRPTIHTVPPSDVRTDSRKRAECDSAYRLTDPEWFCMSIKWSGKATAHDLGGTVV